VPDPDRRPAFYAAAPEAHGWKDWWTLLHPPYTAWHLSYVVIGACLAPHVDALRLTASLLAFFAAVGIAAHALDELHGHPLRTRIADRALIAATVVGLLVAVALGIAGVFRVGPVLIPFILIGPVLVLAYNLELFGGRLHTDIAFAVSWGAFPLLTAYVAQAGRLEFPAVVAAVAAVGFSLAQRSLSTPARALRRRVVRVDGAVVMQDGTVRRLQESALLEPLEHALRALSWSMVALALALVGARLV
jgi:hypothetical protein